MKSLLAMLAAVMLSYNPDSGHQGSVTPRHTWQTAQGQYCREFSTEVSIDGWVEDAWGTACRQPDGSWRIR